MARSKETQGGNRGVRGRIAGFVTRLFSRGGRGDEQIQAASAATAQPQRSATSGAATPGRVTRREADIPLDVIGRTYTPPFTGGKAGFRSDGSDHQSDQEFAYGISDERWNDEDRYTNKSGDPRIGTHRRTYEPGESLSQSRE